MTSPTQQATLAEAGRQVQQNIRTKMLSDVTKLWPLLNAKRLDETWPGWLQVMSQLLIGYQSQAAQAAAAFYRTERARSLGTADPARIVLAPPPAQDWLKGALGWSAPGQLTRTDLPPAQLNKVALVQTLGTASRIIQSGDLNTTTLTAQADPKATGWYRQTSTAPCYFCALISSRGQVFKEDSFNRSNSRFSGDGDAKVHNHCSCRLVPAFHRETPIPTVSKEALNVYYETAAKVPNRDRLKVYRKAWDAHLASQTNDPA